MMSSPIALATAPRSTRLGPLTALAALLAALAPMPSQANIVYTVNFGGITGTIETDGVTGPLSASDYVGFNLSYTEPGFSMHAIGTTPNVSCSGACTLSATASALSLITSGSGATLFKDATDGGNNINLAYIVGAGAPFVYVTANNANGNYRTPLFFGSSFADFGTTSTATAVPEPGALSLVAAGLVGATVARRRRKG